MIVTLERYAYLEDCTRGEMFIGEHTFHSLPQVCNGTAQLQIGHRENPEAAGGLPFKSCVPDGEYRMRSFVRPSGDKVMILSNPDLGVYEQEADMLEPGKGRYLILIHVGNNVEDVVGCIAPGMTGDLKNVWNSRVAMQKVMELLEGYEHKLKIMPRGTNH